ncbi:MAG TPA: nitroreductase family protein [Acidimicrobiales bacterium]|nr:nitroreductase family protein [Acidimicrobiales bacterium]
MDDVEHDAATGAGVIDHLLRQRACRTFTDSHVVDEDLVTMLRAATHAPSAENRQPWVFVVVRDATTRGAIVELSRRVWDGGARRHAQRNLDPGFFAAVDEFVDRGYGGAPVLVVVAGDGRSGVPEPVLASSVFPATQNLLLAAASLGYGSSMTTLAAQVPDVLAAAVGLPAGVRPLAVVPIGRPATPMGRPRRRPVGEVAHLDSFGTPFEPVTAGPSATAEPRHPAPPPA